jgi:hypothetical protein
VRSDCQTYQTATILILGVQTYSVDLTAATGRGSQPYFQQKTASRSLSIGSLTAGFLVKEVLSNLSLELTGILNELCAVSTFLDRSPDEKFQASNWPSLAKCRDDLYIIYLRSKSQNNLLEKANLECCVSLAAEAFRIRIIEEYPVEVSASRTFSDLSNLASLILSDANWHHYQELLFWISFVGSLSARQATDPQYLYWLQMMLKMTLELDIWGWEDARAVLKKFLWIGRGCEIPGRKLWLQVEQIRSSTTEQR